MLNYNKSFDSISNVIKNNGMITDVICEKAKKVIPLTDEEIDLISSCYYGGSGAHGTWQTPCY